MNGPIADGRSTATVGPVHIVGTGLIGGSVALALRRLGVEVTLADQSPAALSVAEHVGAGQRRRANDAEPELVLVASPADVTASVVAEQLRTFRRAAVLDVASVKAVVVDELRQLGADLSRYVGTHPMAGRERSGAAAASADLFVGRPWVIVTTAATDRQAELAARALIVDLGAHPVYLDAEAHDQAVALVSHLPQVLASLAAARLVEAPEMALELAGQGLRDTTRIAASDPNLWAPILVGNGQQVAAVLRRLQVDLDRVIAALELGTSRQVQGEAMLGLTELIAAGNSGVRRIPGKHGGAKRVFDRVTVMVPDRPGELGRLFQEMGRLGVNLEDLSLEHGAGQLVGLAEVSVPPGSGAYLAQQLEAEGWRILK